MNRAMLLLLAGLAAPELGVAQIRDHSTEPKGSQLSRLRDRVNGRREVRVRTPTGRDVFYDPNLASPGTLYLSPPGSGGDSLSLSDIREIQVRGSAAGTGAIIGRAFGGGLGLVGGIALASDPAWDLGPGCVAKATLTGALLLCLPGALIGTASAMRLLGGRERLDVTPPLFFGPLFSRSDRSHPPYPLQILDPRPQSETVAAQVGSRPRIRTALGTLRRSSAHLLGTRSPNVTLPRAYCCALRA